MSYEGYYEYLCEAGHYTTRDVWDQEPTKCEFCPAPIKYRSSVDQTNGYIEDEPITYKAPKFIIGESDIWKKDKYGNRYAETKRLFEPDMQSGRWRTLI